MKVAIIGGGAAGFFAAISVKKHHPECEVTILEKSNKLLSKVRISGGGRCNVTNGTQSIKMLLNGYPRGKSLMKKALKAIDNQGIKEWYQSRGVPLKREADGRVFPTSDSSESIIQCLQKEASKNDITIVLNQDIIRLEVHEKHFELHTRKDESLTFQKVIIASGGSPKKKGFKWLEDLGHDIIDPVPSLFTFNMPGNDITSLMGVVAPNTLVKIQGHKWSSEGPLLITHWGMSGPAVLKLSSFAARDLASNEYNYRITVNWVNLKEENLKEELQSIVNQNSQKQLKSLRPFQLPERLWSFLLNKNELPLSKKWGELGKKGINKLVASLTNDEYHVKGKTTFKEEFVTCGGVSTESINTSTLESKIHPGLYFAGEVLDVDGITGGYNFQAAWSTGYVAGQLG